MTSPVIASASLTRALEVLSPRQFRERAQRPLGEAMRAATVIVKNAARRELGPHRQTGKMRSMIRTKAWGSGFGRRFGVKSTGVGTNLIVAGVRPHPISAEGVMPMWGGRGAWKKGAGLGITGFATGTVRHPGFAADPFFERAITDSTPQINALLDKAAKDIATGVANAIGR